MHVGRPVPCTRYLRGFRHWGTYSRARQLVNASTQLAGDNLCKRWGESGPGLWMCRGKPGDNRWVT